MNTRRQAIRKFVQFHGKEPRQIDEMSVRNFNSIAFLASPELITYASRKRNGGGTGKKEYFKHRFKKSTKMYCSPDGRMLIIMGPQFKVTSRGLEG